MWQQFRVRYPTGSLITELTTVHDGFFVVRAIVRVDGKMLATGLAAAMTVEEAEDSAKIRVLSMLDLSSDAPTSTSSPVLAPGKSVDKSPVQVRQPSVSTGGSRLSPMPPMELPAPSSMANYEPESGGLATEERESMIANDRPDGPAEVLTPTDDSDLMMKTTVEIRRLRWSTEQGRQYLEDTYSKRSRQHLTREELLDFLEYLETQPTP
ncbi:MAG: hypothetical protein WBB29_03590 [Geitlerinemataceae cyanobacterium]